MLDGLRIVMTSTLDNHNLEILARKLCFSRGQHPDMIVPLDRNIQGVALAIFTQVPQWKNAANEIKTFFEVADVLGLFPIDRK